MLNHSVKKFLAGAVVIGLATYVLSCFGLYADVVRAVAKANATVAYAILKNLDPGVNLQGDTLWSASTGQAVSVHSACTGYELVSIMAVIMLAFPAPVRAKIVGVVCMALVIAGVNLVRIMSIYWISIKWPSLLAMAHEQIWLILFNITAVGVLVVWLMWLKRNERPAQSIAA